MIEHPFSALKREIHADPDYAWGWQCNLAVPVMDAIGASHEEANRAAALITMQIFNYDITTHPNYKYGKSQHQEYFEGRVAAERAEDASHD